MNVLRFCHLGEGLEGHVRPLLSQAAMERLFEARELDYLTHMVIRMYENVEVSLWECSFHERA